MTGDGAPDRSAIRSILTVASHVLTFGLRWALSDRGRRRRAAWWRRRAALLRARAARAHARGKHRRAARLLRRARAAEDRARIILGDLPP